jgi:hypothetical protein
MRYDDDEQEIGYKRPPTWAQFKKGQSGNPSGRPRKRKDEPVLVVGSSMADDVLRAELARTVQLTEGGQRKTLEMLQLVTRAQLKAAATGNHIAQRDVLRQARELEERDTARAEQAEQEKRGIYRAAADWKKQRTVEWASAQAKGEEPDPVWPHPDDILLFPEKFKWTVRGPVTEDGLKHFEYCRAERDWLFAMAALDRRTRKSRDIGGLSMYDLWILWDRWLPLRWQIMNKLDSTMWHYEALPLPRLQAIVDEAERRARRLQPPPDREKDKAAYKTVNELMKPILKIYGFRSLAQFEAQYAAKGDTMKLVKVVPQAKSQTK